MKNNKIIYIVTLALSAYAAAQQLLIISQAIKVWTWVFIILGAISGVAGLMGKSWSKKILIAAWAVGLIATVLGGQFVLAAVFAVMLGLSFVFG